MSFIEKLFNFNIFHLNGPFRWKDKMRANNTCNFAIYSSIWNSFEVHKTRHSTVSIEPKQIKSPKYAQHHFTRMKNSTKYVANTMEFFRTQFVALYDYTCFMAWITFCFVCFMCDEFEHEKWNACMKSDEEERPKDAFEITFAMLVFLFLSFSLLNNCCCGWT